MALPPQTATTANRNNYAALPPTSGALWRLGAFFPFLPRYTCARVCAYGIQNNVPKCHTTQETSTILTPCGVALHKLKAPQSATTATGAP